MARGEIAQDGVRFPDDRVIVADHRDPAMRIHRQEIRRIEPAKTAAGVDMLMGEAQLANQPHHLLDIE
jgi:hypothetical protein